MKHFLAICAIVKNEHDYLLEWIAYHRVVGVDHFLIYNNSSDIEDGTTVLLNKLQGIGAIEVVPWPDRPKWCLPSGDVCTRPQIPAYYDGIERLRDEAEWVAFIDVDEFILPLQEKDLPSTLKFYEHFGGVAANWRMFGFSGETKKRDIPVCKRFTMAALPDDVVNQHVKCIARAASIRDVGIHRPFLKGGILVDEHGRELKHAFGFRYPVSYDILRINHYYTKSQEEWLAKVARGRASRPEKRQENSVSPAHFSDECDTSILKFYDATVQAMRALAEAAGVADYPCLRETGPPGQIDSTSGRFHGGKKIPGSSSASRRNRSSKPIEASQAARQIGPVLDVHLIGSLANRMMQYMVARHIAAGVEGCCISNARMPAWGIHHALLPGALGPELEPRKSRHEIDVARVMDLLSRNVRSRGTFQSNVQWLSNFPELDLCRSLFKANEHDYPGFGAEYLVCNLKTVELLDGSQVHQVLLPMEFYSELAQTTGLKLVFMGQVEDDAYSRALKRRFPHAAFHPSRGAMADFQTFRNSKNLVVAVNPSSWLAAWLSKADVIVLPVNGLFHPVQEPNVDLLPRADERYRFYLFPINFAVPVDRFEEAHRALQGNWRPVSGETLSKLRTPRKPKRLEPFVSVFDEAFYLRTYQDVSAVVRKGNFGSGLAHYVKHGFREGRYAFAFDQHWYSRAYPNAALEVGLGDYADLRHHYVEVGASQGCKPLPNRAK